MTFDPARLADDLARAELSASPIPLVTTRFPSMSWSDARAIARARDAKRINDGDVLIGYKLGWTSAVMREALGIERPNWGTLWRSQIVDGSSSLTGLIHPKLEPELVYRCRADLDGGATSASVDADGAWALGIEVVDPRWPTYEFDLLDNTADNSSGARVAFGPFSRLATPAEIEVEFDDDFTRVTGRGANAMGDPRQAVAWLANSLAEEGAALRSGDIVFTGGLTAPMDLVAGRTYTVRAAGLTTVALPA